MSLVTWAHPRSRGENQSKHTRSPACAGSSPLTRGKLGVGHCAIDCHGLIPAHAGKTNRVPCKPGDAGLIPAHAGKTTGQTAVRGGDWAHPRSRGENDILNATGFRLTGSSPLTRGKPARGRVTFRSGRLIPAHAGKTGLCDTPVVSHRAHPRSRGENSAPPPRLSPSTGSSPLTRGKHGRRARGAAGPRLIPAHAGKTRTRSARATRNRAHPRSRGENDPGSTQPERLMGSSPLTRGKPTHSAQRPYAPGLIPAHAGKTRRSRRTWLSSGAHPRSRGENQAAYATLKDYRGSSPLTRGKRVPARAGRQQARLIPAHAGKTHARHVAGHTPRAHPRSRGENSYIPGGDTGVKGSSPLTRGKRQ